ncbi:N-acetylmuramoyl-L-alanine amidase family protein [Psychrobacillus sp. FSL K6-1267]|uniref:N-acetylmuramoyl-L-alanine amidase family protein n=1 Tax=Psychrobacillus sp. FSL K6-1267 TaxID=2921543 RepID=UPI0030FAF578
MSKPSNFLIALDDGHGMQTAGKRTPIIPELGRYIPENEFNRAVVNLMDKMLRDIGFKTLLVAPTDADTSLKARTDLANSSKADIFISIHFDAMGSTWGTAEGHSIFVYPGSASSKKLAECIAEFLKQGTTQKWRGIKEQNFHVLRETKMPSILSENGFMDNPREARLMVDKDFQKEVAREHVQGICEYFGVKFIEKEVAGVSEQKIVLSPGQQKAKDSLVKHGLMAANYEVMDSVDVRLITMLAPLLNKLEEKGSI